MKLSLRTPPDFDFASAVCSHGFFMLAPNLWDPRRQRLRTVLAPAEDIAVTVTMRGARGRVVVEAPGASPGIAARRVREAVVRMLRLDEDLSAFHALCRESPGHAAAAAMRFGRLLRGASLFEDVVKVICTCNITWRQTVAIVQKLVDGWGVATDGGGPRSFPTPARLASADVDRLRVEARLGYRAPFVHDLARTVCEGTLDLEAIGRFDGPTEDLFRMLRAIRGVGPYAAANLCMLLGRYDRLAVDTELIRFLRERHPRRRFTPQGVQAYYRRWHPYQFLAYWFELWQGYVQTHGPSATWSPAETGARITASRAAPAEPAAPLRGAGG